MAMQPWMYVVLLGLILIVYARFLPKEQAAASTKMNVVQEIEETIEHFAAEMDEQNQTLLNLFSKTKQDYEIELAKLAGRLESLEKQKHELSQELTKVHVNHQLNQRTNAATDVLSGLQNAVISEIPVSNPAHSVQVTASELVAPTIESVVEEPIYTGLSMKSRYKELFSLYDQGKGVEAIAKKLGMNKGEVSLILQLSRQEEMTRV
ncbi:hypothetical protein M5X11_09760 [Paenibacillus alginolyticus]|uniref:Uncharacterized protein n=1 Tax=Paenibacillus alginolyticus TaxID=59839 RepID=A0ABT4G8K8_9BACL|nr:hypothetical protein [Paenibacillus alginolyticus]MCY9665244.1 hypothetical protein [Paenibacillus alginolyticus]MCY9692463.1 hypothetical protein [Paenibacillus alginolyticus]MEC0143934.1 hypothetical protein [Paenibacillus alginolyticus]